jgi:hypothetical protein
MKVKMFGKVCNFTGWGVLDFYGFLLVGFVELPLHVIEFNGI